MMEVEVLKCFYDKNDNTKIYNAGDVVSFDVERATSLIERGFVKKAQGETLKPIEEEETEKEVVKEQKNKRKRKK